MAGILQDLAVTGSPKINIKFFFHLYPEYVMHKFISKTALLKFRGEKLDVIFSNTVSRKRNYPKHNFRFLTWQTLRIMCRRNSTKRLAISGIFSAFHFLIMMIFNRMIAFLPETIPPCFEFLAIFNAFSFLPKKISQKR